MSSCWLTLNPTLAAPRLTRVRMAVEIERRLWDLTPVKLSVDYVQQN